MKLKGMQTHQLLAALGTTLAAVLLAGPAAARPVDDGGSSNRAADAQSVPWYLTDEYRPFVLPESANGVIENQRQMELAADAQSTQVIPYLSHGILTPSDAAALAAESNAPDGYQPQLGLSAADSGAASLRDRPDSYRPQRGVPEAGSIADDGFDWTTTGFAASIIAAMLVALALTFTRGNRHGYRSA